jgi:bifunctional UDP-N-acetylglucosamine pyrophosphorylase/glucosamine-1-phosphate N-acetyltransferase
VLVVGNGADGVRALFGDSAEYAIQAEQLGTGHATAMAKAALQGRAAQVIVLAGDMPLIRAATLEKLATMQRETAAAVVILGVDGEHTSSFGRILRDEQGRVSEVCEVAEAKRRPNTAEILAVREQNASVYCFDAEFLWSNIDNLPIRQARSGQEYYLTDMVEVAVQQGLRVDATLAEDATERLGAGTRAELVAVEKAFRQRAIDYWLDHSVTIIDPNNTYIDQDVQIGKDTVIWPNSYIQGDTVIGEDCVVGPNAVVRSAEVGDRCIIEQSVVENVIVAPDTYLAPFSHALPMELNDE